MARTGQEEAKLDLKRAVWLCVGAAVVLCLAGWLMYAWADKDTAAWCRAHTYPWHKRPWFRAITQLGKAWFQICLLILWAFAGGARRALLPALLAMALAAAIVVPVKGLVRRPRPHEEAQAISPAEDRFFRSWSFPSGDTADTFALAVSLTPFLGVPWRVVLLALATEVGLARIASLHHYPSDVAVGAALGILCGLCAIAVYRRWASRAPPS
jgi:undecaprenyl-diphosphatase